MLQNVEGNKNRVENFFSRIILGVDNKQIDEILKRYVIW